jgi:hypothetical protein
VDTDDAYDAISNEVRVLRDAANGLKVTPTEDMGALLSLYTDTGEHPELATDEGINNQCADRPAPRDPEVYWNDIRDHLAAEPLYGPLFRNITPCAFWPTNPIEAPTTIDNDHPALMVGSTGDPAVGFAGTGCSCWTATPASTPW